MYNTHMQSLSDKVKKRKQIEVSGKCKFFCLHDGINDNITKQSLFIQEKVKSHTIYSLNSVNFFSKGIRHSFLIYEHLLLLGSISFPLTTNGVSD